MRTATDSFVRDAALMFARGVEHVHRRIDLESFYCANAAFHGDYFNAYDYARDLYRCARLLWLTSDPAAFAWSLQLDVL